MLRTLQIQQMDQLSTFITIVKKVYSVGALEYAFLAHIV